MNKLPFPRAAVAWARLLGKSAACLVVPLLIALPAKGGEFAVSPIRLDLDQTNPNGSITISNDALADLKIQLRLYEWLQDPAGKDQYRKSEELLFFPRLATIAAQKQRVVRVGLRGAPSQRQEKEKSYRLFVEELPEKTAPTDGARLAIAVRFGVPIFVRPLSEKASGTVQTRMKNGKLRMRVRNTGNVHFKISSITASSGDLFSKEISGWYLLSGAQREYAMNIPSDICARLNHIDVVVISDKLRLKGALDATPEMCGG